ncbi:type VI secretion system tube protein Hcp [Rhodobacterales bacterium]|nr:type VI secretion system tube protein Hcp [Rhodobacterales bacterium]
MAFDCFLELKGVTGESQDKKHKDKIDVLSWSWGATQSGTTHMGSGGGGGRSHFQDISLTKFVDRASPTLLQYVSKGKHITNGTLYVRKAGGESPLEYIKIELTDIIVASYSVGGVGSEDQISEQISLNFRKYKFVYTEQSKTGGKGASPEFEFDIAANA